MTASRTSAPVLPDCRPLLADPGDLTLVFQPIVDLAAGRVAAYAALPRFPGTAAPEAWSAAARDLGVDAELAALTLHRALTARAELPPGACLVVDVAAHLLGSAPVQEALDPADDLRRLVVRLTTDTRPDVAALGRGAGALRDRGALVALDGAGSGWPGLEVLAAVRPQLVTIDGGPDDAEPGRRSLADAVCDLAERVGAVLVAEDIETPADLAAAVRSGIPLGRGWLLGRPEAGVRPPAPEVERLVRAHADRARLADSVAGLVRPARQVAEGDPVPAVPPAVLVGADEEPRALRLADPRTGEVYTAAVSLRVAPDADVRETLHRALARPPGRRYDPVVCTDATGAVVGLLRVEDLAAAL
ncbi:EAL domain-containing protein [Trujillonella endophytica]|uniref:EAL domain, c-di-GMP-specific phosphodiesterase class I (Or its enzymatically inactive variant) n=1 Tax=Trujillonella endophytica TaxID=673521 RepID=A0A1H8WRQ9_9ACTN|nr:EAL domain-containing protein [Trujillella endophytica]SEP30296.1 EAL domain, c-di-GMP-specific phosphodiesterase class I (or its enzymatically inactive variant) [Trujillella endophytica]